MLLSEVQQMSVSRRKETTVRTAAWNKMLRRTMVRAEKRGQCGYTRQVVEREEGRGQTSMKTNRERRLRRKIPTAHPKLFEKYIVQLDQATYRFEYMAFTHHFLAFLQNKFFFFICTAAVRDHIGFEDPSGPVGSAASDYEHITA
ncbi:unnamed protein product [Gongylonema pulchrum]|uniref:Uncharacterized protein n=1 Tax=Gongylonema pulchrum TaxID=637853 RepID=A0A183DAH5_9BILA|nr:unnamed protein product [Gongylonema pulchrum]